MNKQELIDAMSSASGLTKTDSYKSLEALIDVVTTTLKSGDEVRITNFGTFCSIKRPATKGRNPQTGETIKIPASYQPKFRAGKGLKTTINKNKK